MASLKDVKVKISGVGKTKQITKAMNMVASAKLRGAQSRIERFRPYAQTFQSVFADLASKAGDISHPLLVVREVRKNALIVLITSDRGLCGSFNVSLIAKAIDLARRHTQEGKQVSFVCVGKKARDAIRKTEFAVKSVYVDEMSALEFSLATRIGKEIMSAYQLAEYDEVHLVYGFFQGTARQIPTVMPLLPIVYTAGEPGEQLSADQRERLYEPHVTELLGELMPRYVNVQLYRALLDSSASEHAARMAAMDNATRNCNDMISTLTLLFNKTRQTAITRDLMDIVGGAEALVN